MVQVGDQLTEGTFLHVPWSQAVADNVACGNAVKLDTSQWKDKKVVLVGIPGAFTPTCHAQHLPEFIKESEKLKGKGVDVIAVITANDPWVNSAWGTHTGANVRK